MYLNKCHKMSLIGPKGSNSEKVYQQWIKPRALRVAGAILRAPHISATRRVTEPEKVGIGVWASQ